MTRVHPYVSPGDDARQQGGGPFESFRPAARPRLRTGVLAMVFAGGCAGGLLRYVVVKTWPAPARGFPWSTFAVNIGGAFVLALLLVLLSEVVGPTAYLRPLLGTGFCGALTTFSSIVVTVDELIAHGHPATATGYLVATIGCGAIAGMLGVTSARSFAVYRRRSREAGSI